MTLSSRIEGPLRSEASLKAFGLSPRDWLDLAVGSVELGLARVRIATCDRAALVRPEKAASPITNEPDMRVERVRLAIARASHRLPWRADCLVQAIAARRWLRRLGVETSLCIGVADRTKDPFEAHAWLMHGERVITGGDISGYIPVLNSTTRIDSDKSCRH
jgi:Transglutaminase-like superfamily